MIYCVNPVSGLIGSIEADVDLAEIDTYVDLNFFENDQNKIIKRSEVLKSIESLLNTW